eukprot:148272-Hanusia_phi.AAC.2
MRVLLTTLIAAQRGLAVPDGYYGTLAPMVVAEMQKVFVLRDGSTIQSSTDGVVLQAVYNELLSMSPAFESVASLNGLRNATLFPDQELVRILLLAVMGNFHSQTLKDADIYNDVQVVYDPVSQRFVTRQNMRDTEIVVFQVLLIVCVIGLFLLFIVGHRDEHAKVHPEPAREEKQAEVVQSSASMGGRLALPQWAQGSRLAHRGAGTAW